MTSNIKCEKLFIGFFGRLVAGFSWMVCGCVKSLSVESLPCLESGHCKWFKQSCNESE